MKKVLVDIIPVLVGILLALFVNNWQQTRSEKAYIENSIRAIVMENESNIAELTNSLMRQQSFIDTLRKYNTDEYMMSDIMRLAQGLNTPDLKSTTWKFLIQDSKHTLVDYEFISRLAEIEKYETLVNRYNQKVSDLIYQTAHFNDPAMKQVCLVMLYDFRATESELRSVLEEFNSFARTQGY